MGGINKDASVTVGVEGADAASAAATKVAGTWQSAAEKAKSAMTGLGKEVASAAGQMISDLGRVAGALTAMSIPEAAAKYRAYSQDLTRYSISGGNSVAGLKDQFADLEKYTLQSDEANAKFAMGLSHATYGANVSKSVMKALGAESIATGRSMDEMGGMAATVLNNMGGSLNDIPTQLGEVRAMAERLGTVGGPAALQEQIAGLSGVLSQFSTKSPEARKQAEALVAALGKGKSPEQAKRVQGAVLGLLSGQQENVRRTLGMKDTDFYDENGQQRDPLANLLKLRQLATRRYGKDATRVLGNWLGSREAGAAVMQLDEAELKNLASVKPSTSAAAKAAQALNRPEVQDQLKKMQSDRANREGPGKAAADAQSAWLDMFKDHPILGKVAQFGLSTGAVAAGKAIQSKVASALGGSAAAEGGGAAASGGAATPTAAAGAIPGAVGAGLLGAAGLSALVIGGGLSGMVEQAEASPKNQAATTAMLMNQREGRARAIARAFERSGGSSKAFTKELGAPLGAMMAHDPGLSNFGRGLFEGMVPQALSQSPSPSDQQLAKLLTDILAESKKQSDLMRTEIAGESPAPAQAQRPKRKRQ